MKGNPLYTHAFQFMVRGYSVMPVGKDKRPLLRSWKKYQTEPADEDQIKAWWEQWPDANIGIITGKVSGISVVDVDTYNGGDSSKFPPTFTVKTGNGGAHLYYEYQEGLSISANAYKDMPFVDIRSDGGYVVAPHSVTEYEKDGKPAGGEYTIIFDAPLAKFPIDFFKTKNKRSLSSKIGVTAGGRNDTIASFIGQLLHAAPLEEWESEVWPSVQTANKTYQPPLGQTELRTTFDSIVKKEQARRQTLIVSPMQLEDGEKVDIMIRKNGSGVPYKDMANALAVLSQHPYYKGQIRYNEFKQEIEYRGQPLEEKDIIKMQYFLQTDAKLHGIGKEAVYAAIQHYSSQNSYDEAKEWLTALKWDGTERLKSWIARATGVEDDTYHAGIGSQWFMGMIRRLMVPGSTFDYVLLLVGPQGIGKTSFFRIIGGPWYKSYTGAMDNKDFYLALRGAMVVDLDEGAALYHSEAIKIKSIISETHDEYRAPYDRVMKKYPRRFVFSMSTNDTEPFRDSTGNRRYWVIDADKPVDFKWLEENRDQLFAEAYDAFLKNTKLPDVPFDIASDRQEAHLPDDAWTDLIMNELLKSPAYCEGDPEYFTTIGEVYQRVFTDETMARFGKAQEMRIGNIFKKNGGLMKRRMMVDGDRKVRWMLTPQRRDQLQAQNATTTRLPLEEEFDDDELPKI